MERGKKAGSNQNAADAKTSLSGLSFHLLGTTRLKSFSHQWVGWFILLFFLLPIYYIYPVTFHLLFPFFFDFNVLNTPPLIICLQTCQAFFPFGSSAAFQHIWRSYWRLTAVHQYRCCCSAAERQITSSLPFTAPLSPCRASHLFGHSITQRVYVL